MKIKLDENVPESCAEVLRSFGHDADTVRAESLCGADDDTVWAAAQESGRFLVTQDLDFADLRRFVFGHHCGILVLRLKEPKRRALRDRIEKILEAEDIDQWAHAFVIATDHKIRIRRSHE
jgi:predicted nuclease of predicted toxin-antitoxin system